MRMLWDVGYEWTGWALDHLRGIEPWEVIQALTGKRARWPRRGRDQAGASILTIWGRTTAGRALIIGVYQADDWTWHIAAARDMTDHELTQFTQWEETQR